MRARHTLLTLAAALVLGTEGRATAPETIVVQRPAALALPPAFPNLPAFTQPVAMLQAPGDTSRWFVVEKAGVVRVFANEAGVSSARVFADITRKVHTGGELEAGLLGMAFDPGFGLGAGKNRRVYVFYSAAPNAGFRLRLTISRFEATPALDALDVGSETRLISIDKLETNHNGGHLLFGPDGMLHVGVGEGGGEPNAWAQDDAVLFGKILRINPAVSSGRVPYSIPPDNPNASNPACNGNGRGRRACPEVWARGLRNPWRFTFDAVTKQLWAGDVGWGGFEEVDVVTRGGNYGWPLMEGAACLKAGCDRTGLVDPVYSVPRGDGQSITGGYVYRGTKSPAFTGAYIYADFESGMFAAVTAGATSDSYANRTLIAPFPPGALQVSSFAEGSDGELLVLDFRTGRVHALEFPPGPK